MDSVYQVSQYLDPMHLNFVYQVSQCLDPEHGHNPKDMGVEKSNIIYEYNDRELLFSVS
jgi:hypothetical protein